MKRETKKKLKNAGLSAMIVTSVIASPVMLTACTQTDNISNTNDQQLEKKEDQPERKIDTGHRPAPRFEPILNAPKPTPIKGGWLSPLSNVHNTLTHLNARVNYASYDFTKIGMNVHPSIAYLRRASESDGTVPIYVDNKKLTPQHTQWVKDCAAELNYHLANINENYKLTVSGIEYKTGTSLPKKGMYIISEDNITRDEMVLNGYAIHSDIHYREGLFTIPFTQINLNTTTARKPVVMHEMLHGLGFYEGYSISPNRIGGLCDETTAMRTCPGIGNFAITPNDLLVLYSFYGNQADSGNYARFINHYIQFEKKYYEDLTDAFIAEAEKMHADFDSSRLEKIDIEKKITAVGKRETMVFNNDGTYYEYENPSRVGNYINVNDKAYIIEFKEEDDEYGFEGDAAYHILLKSAGSYYLCTLNCSKVVVNKCVKPKIETVYKPEQIKATSVLIQEPEIYTVSDADYSKE